MKKYLYILVGSISLALGILGIFLPVLPTTPFLLLAATCYVRSSYRLYRWLVSHRYLGTYIRGFLKDRAIPLKAKVISISLLWLTALYCIFIVFAACWTKILMGVVAVSVTAYILSFKTRKLTCPRT